MSRWRFWSSWISPNPRRKDLPVPALDLEVKSKSVVPRFVFYFTFAEGKSLHLMLHRPKRSLVWSVLCADCYLKAMESTAITCHWGCELRELKGEQLRLQIEELLPTDPLTAAFESYEWQTFLTAQAEAYLPTIQRRERQLAAARSQIETARRQIKAATKDLERQRNFMQWDLNAPYNTRSTQDRMKKRMQRKLRTKHRK